MTSAFPLVRFLIGAAVPAMIAATPAAAENVVLQVGTLVDGDASVRHDMSVIVENDKIKEVVAGFVERPNFRTIDLRAVSVMPGMINVHVHLVRRLPDINTLDGRPQGILEATMAAIPGFKAFLDNGFTTVRSLGSPDGSDLALKRAAEAGELPGPRVWASLEPLGPTGGHSDERNHAATEDVQHGWMNAVADGPDGFRQQVRLHRLRGADVIKIMPSGGVTSVGDNPNQMTMGEDEIAAAVDAAHALGLRVAAHAQADKAIVSATRLGVDSIEHGTLASDDTFKLMKQKGTFLVPTMSVGQMFSEKIAQDAGAVPHRSEKMMAMWNRKLASVRSAYRIGVKIAFGTDTDAANSEREFALLHEAGISNADIVREASVNAAELLGAGERLGRVQPGYLADLIAVEGNPIDDVSAFTKVRFVMKGGTVYKDALH